MPAFRYGSQEAANIAASEARSKQQSALNASISRRLAKAEVGAVTKTSIGLGSVDNTSDAGKPVSTAQQTALNGKLGTWVTAPATASSAGTAGQIARDSGFIYVCVATNTWCRAAIATW
jgi:hypothetical protein